MKKIFVKDYGCQMNVYDSERMREIMGLAGYVATSQADDADLVILNTCHIREKAAEKVYSDIGRLRQRSASAANGGTLIAVAGCVAQAEGQEIIRRAPRVDFVFGPQAYHALPDLVQRARAGEKVVATDFPAVEKFAQLPQRTRRRRASPTAFLTVQEGCDKFCAFCVVPYTRGAEVSRPVADIVSEAGGLIDQGVIEITLLGQNVNAYHGAGTNGRSASLADLIAALAELPGLARIRYTTSHPNDMTDDLIDAHRDIDKLMPYLHLPIQSGSDRVLRAMNRRHDVARYVDIIDRLRVARPDIALSSDFIVGFPGETEEDFQHTVRLSRDIYFAHSYSFKYSPRPGTPGADMENQISEQIKSDRLRILQEELNKNQKKFNNMFVGKTVEVLFEKSGRHPGQLVGRSPYLQPVHANASKHLSGTIQHVTIDSVAANSLLGHLADAESLR